MILLDTNVVVALVDKRDELYERALADAKRLARQRLLLITPVLAEATFLLPGKELREGFWSLIQVLDLQPLQVTEDAALWDEIFAWLIRYEEHEPDWTDAYLAVMSGREPRLKIWSYDREFWQIWRRPNGTRIPLAVHPVR